MAVLFFQVISETANPFADRLSCLLPFRQSWRWDIHHTIPDLTSRTATKMNPVYLHRRRLADRIIRLKGFSTFRNTQPIWTGCHACLIFLLGPEYLQWRTDYLLNPQPDFVVVHRILFRSFPQLSPLLICDSVVLFCTISVWSLLKHACSHWKPKKPFGQRRPSSRKTTFVTSCYLRRNLKNGHSTG